MGFTPNNNGSSVIIPIPTIKRGEKKVELIKVAHGIIEDAERYLLEILEEIPFINSFIKEKEDNVSEDLIKDKEGDTSIDR